MIGLSKRTKYAHLIGFLALVVSLSGCFRDGFECESSDDCFDGETCSDGACVGSENNACRPASDEQLCAAAEPCQEELQVTDSCGTLRQIACECSDTCQAEEDQALCEAAGATCGTVATTDSCGAERNVVCGGCDDSQTCIDNACAECSAPMCPDDAACGVATNGCGTTVQCGSTCGDGELCIEFECVAPILQPAETAAGDRFGETIELDGDFVFVGAPYTDADTLDDVGAIYVYLRNDSSLALWQVIRPTDAVADARFGQVFDVAGDLLLVGTKTNLLAYRLNARNAFEPLSSQPVPSRVLALGIFGGDNFVMGFEDTGDRESLFRGSCSNDGCELEADAWMPPDVGDEVGRLGLGAVIDTAGATAIVGAPADNVDVMTDSAAEGGVYILSESAIDGDWFQTQWGPITTFRYLNFTNFPTEEEPSIRAGSSVAITTDGFAGFGAPDSNPPELTERIGEVFLMAPTPGRPFSVESRYRGVTNAAFESCGHAIDFVGETTSKVALVSCLYARDREDIDELTTTQQQQTVGEVRRYDLQPLGDWRINSPPLQSTDSFSFDHYGWAIAADESTALVGAPGRNSDRGQVFIYSIEEVKR